MGYRRNPDWGWEDAATSGMTGLVLLVAIAVAAMAATLLIVLCKELVRIYLIHGREPTLTARVLWAALAGFALIIALAWAAVAAASTLAAPIIYLAALSFPAYILTVEGCDLYAQRQELQELAAAEDLAAAALPDPWWNAMAAPGGR